MTYNISKDNQLKLMEHPLMDVCVNQEVVGFNPIKLLLSSAYSRVITENHLEKDLIEFFKNPILDDILSAVAIASTNRALTIELIEGEMNKYYLEDNATAFISHYYNRIVISENAPSALSKKAFVHELTHKAIMVIFKNDSNPYKTLEQKEQYHDALKQVILNICEFFNQQYKNSINLNDQSDLYQMSKQLVDTRLKMSYYIGKKRNSEIIDIFKNNPELDINSKDFYGLNGDSCVNSALTLGNFNLVVELIKAGAAINEGFKDGLFRVIIDNNIEVIKSVTEARPQLNHNELSIFREMLKIAQFVNKTEIVNIFKPYIEDNDTWYNYFSSFIPKISVKWHNDKPQENEKLFQEIITFLTPVYESYDQLGLDSEYIATFISTMATNENNQKLLNIFQPLINYVDDVVHSEFLGYQQESDSTTFCASLFEYAEM